MRNPRTDTIINYNLTIKNPLNKTNIYTNGKPYHNYTSNITFKTKKKPFKISPTYDNGSTWCKDT